MQNFYSDLARQYKQGMSKNHLTKLKCRLAKKHNLASIPRDSDIRLKLDLDIRTKPSRTQSGVAPIAVMTKPISCPHGKCAYCPGGPKSQFNSPQSYTGMEPSAMRAKRNNYDPYLIVFNRLEQYICLNQSPEKAELIIQGGTFPSFPKSYQEYIIAYSLKALNDFSKLFYNKNKLKINKFKKFFLLPSKIQEKERTKKIQEKILKFKTATNLNKEQLRNEKSQIRCIGLTIETRPDYALLKNANHLLKLGCTRVELGIQTLNPKILISINRGHTLNETKKSLKILKDLGFKINAHMMLGLPGQTKNEIIKEFKNLFSQEDFKPDMLKIYPCLVLKDTQLYERWKSGKYNPLSIKKTAEIIAEIKSFIPKYCRIMRIQRDIPSTQIIAGPILTNLRQLVENICKKKEIKCQCIRCREPKNNPANNPKIEIQEYDSSGGKEYFISLEDKKQNIILGFCRMRLPSQQLRKEINSKSAIIRELHIYSQSLPLGAKPTRESMQHKGFGKKLMQTAEKIARQNKKDKLLVISGIGAKQYYITKLGYKKDGPYVSKQIS